MQKICYTEATCFGNTPPTLQVVYNPKTLCTILMSQTVDKRNTRSYKIQLHSLQSNLHGSLYFVMKQFFFLLFFFNKKWNTLTKGKKTRSYFKNVIK